MLIFQAIFLGFIQSIAEFLPISSSAHLILMPWFFNFQEIGRSFDVALHLGTLFSIIIFFKKDIIGLFNNKNLSFVIIIATLPVIFLGYFLSKIEIRNPLFIAINLMIFGVILYLFDKKFKQEINIDKISFKQALIIGFAQVLAIFPGVSRSGITISTARALKISKESSAKFSFLLAIPVILGAGIVDFKDILIQSTHYGHLNEFIIGFISSFIFGILAIKILLNFIKKYDFKFFMIYRIVLAILIFIFYFTQH